MDNFGMGKGGFGEHQIAKTSTFTTSYGDGAATDAFRRCFCSLECAQIRQCGM